MKPELNDVLLKESLPLMWARSPLRGKYAGGYPKETGKDLVWRRLPQRSSPTGPSYKRAGDGEVGHPSPKWGVDPPHMGTSIKEAPLCNYFWLIGGVPKSLCNHELSVIVVIIVSIVIVVIICDQFSYTHTKST